MRRWLIFGVVACGILAGWLLWRTGTQSTSPKFQRSAPDAGSAPVATPEPRATADAAPVATPASSGRSVRLRADWGSAAGQLGRRGDPEGAPEGPMSLTVSSDGQLLVLDEVNERVQRFDAAGRVTAEIRLGNDTAQDLALGPRGDLYVLDRLGRGEVLVFDAAGQPVGKQPVVGGPVREGGELTGIFADEGGVYLERAHTELVRIADGAGQTLAEREILPGRPTRDGCCFVRAARAGRGSPLVTVTVLGRDGKVRWERTVPFPRRVLRVLLLDSDRRGRVYVGARVADLDAAPPYAPINVATVVQRLALGDGSPAGTLALAVPAGPEEMLRELAVSDDGDVLQMLPGEAGVEIVVWR